MSDEQNNQTNEESSEKKAKEKKISVVQRIQKITCEHLDWTSEQVQELIKTEGLECKENTLLMTYRNVHLIVDKLKALDLLKADI